MSITSNAVIKNMTPSQKKILIITSIALLTFFMSWLLIYCPAKAKISQLQKKLTDIEREINEIEGAVTKGTSFEEGIRLLEERAYTLDSKFPEKEKEALKMLADFARQLNMDIISTQPQTKKPFLGADEGEVRIETKSCQELFVFIEMKGTYQNLIRYLVLLKESLPAYVMVERLKINKDVTGALKLNISLGLNLYLQS